jgi:hypothetical protein
MGMADGSSSSYFQPMPEKSSLSSKMNFLSKVNYWNLLSILKLLHRRRYKREAKLLVELGQLHLSRGGVAVRYELKGGVATFDISSDRGKSYLNYLRANAMENSEESSNEIVNSIATIEARIMTKTCFIY